MIFESAKAIMKFERSSSSSSSFKSNIASSKVKRHDS
jgi:hypothetical protein